MQETFTTIYVVRHGQSEGNIKTDEAVRVAIQKYGELGSPLTELGRKQAQVTAEKLNSVHFDAIFSSDLTRAVETAEIIAKGRNLQVFANSTIREREYGNAFWELSHAEREKIIAGLNDLNDEESLDHRFFPDSETEREGAERFIAFIKEITPLYRGKTVLVANHGNIMRTFLRIIKYKPFRAIGPGAVQNGGYFVLETDGSTFTVKDTYNIIIRNQHHGSDT